MLLLIDDVMHTGERVPHNKPADWLDDVLVEMTRKGLGMTVVTDADQRVLGVFTRW